MAAKVRPCLILTPQPKSDKLDVFTVIAHTTARRGSQWEMTISKPFLDDQGAFDTQRVATVAKVNSAKYGKSGKPTLAMTQPRLPAAPLL